MTTHFQVLNPLLHGASPSAGAVLFAVSALRGTTFKRELDRHKLIALRCIFKLLKPKCIKMKKYQRGTKSIKRVVAVSI